MSDSRQTRAVLCHQNRVMRPAAASKQEAATAPVDVPALAAALITVTLWGSAFVGIRAAGQTFSPGGLAVGRLLVSTAVLGAVALFRRQPLPHRRVSGLQTAATRRLLASSCVRSPCWPTPSPSSSRSES